MKTKVSCQCGASADLFHGPFRDTDVVAFARTDDVGEGAHGFFQRRLVVVAMGLVDIDVVHLQAPERAVDGFHDALTGQGAVVLTGTRRKEHFGPDFQTFAADPFQSFAEHRFGFGVPRIARSH